MSRHFVTVCCRLTFHWHLFRIQSGIQLAVEGVRKRCGREARDWVVRLAARRWDWGSAVRFRSSLCHSSHCDPLFNEEANKRHLTMAMHRLPMPPTSFLRSSRALVCESHGVCACDSYNILKWLIGEISSTNRSICFWRWGQEDTRC